MPSSTCDSFSSGLEDSPPNGVDLPATPPTEDLLIRLAVLTMDYEAAKKENIRKDAFIEQLLGCRALFEKQVDKLSKEILALKQLLVEIKKDDQELRVNLHKALTAVSALASLPTVATSSHSNSAVSKTNSIAAHDTYHIVDSYFHEGDHANAEPASHEDEDDEDYMTDISDDIQICTPQYATLSRGHDSAFENQPYIHHFVHEDGATNAHEGRAVVETTDERNEQPLQYTALSEALKGFPDRFISTSSEDASVTASSPEGSKGSSKLPLSCLVEAPKDPKQVDSIEPRWNCSTLFEINNELTEALYHHELTAGLHSRTPGFLKYGLRFMPTDNQNIYRTIMISGIPDNVSLHMVLDAVRGGAVIEAKLLDTLKMTGSNTARIIFLYENSAFVYEEHTKKQPITFNGIVATVAVVPTPTWPMRPELRNAVVSYRHSRCLALRNLPHSISHSRLRKDIGFSKELNLDHLIHTEVCEDGTLSLEFSSIDGAGRAYELLSNSRYYHGCKPFFALDPCCLPVTTLLPFREIDSAKEDSADDEQRSQDLPYNCPSPTTETSFSVSSTETSPADMMASTEL